MVISTPGGMLSGVRPSLDGRVVVAEKLRRAAAAAVCWKAGTRKPGRVTTVEEAEAEAAASRTLLRLGANIVMVVGVVVVRLRRGRFGRDAAGAELAKTRRSSPIRGPEVLAISRSQGQPAGRWDGPRVDLHGRAPKNVSDLGAA